MSKAADISAAIERLCQARGYHFKPWQPRPWEVDQPEPPAWAGGVTSAWTQEWPRIWRLRQQLLAEIEAAG
jgi:hypothetical protein